MVKFKVGDKVHILDAGKIEFAVEKGFNTDGIYEVTTIYLDGTPVITNGKRILEFHLLELQYIEKVDKPTKKQRIEALEKYQDTLKDIIKKLEERTFQSTLQFKTLQEEFFSLKERIEALEQAEKQRYVVSNSNLYKVAVKTNASLTLKPEEPPKTPNQQRKEIIEKAKGFIEKYGEGFLFDSAENHICAAKLEKIQDDVGYGSCIGYSRCHRNDVFNVHIGKAIALGRALGKDVSEFKNAVKPTEVVVGMNVKSKNGKTFYVHGFHKDEKYGRTIATRGINDPHWIAIEQVTILDDTNAVYEVEK